MASAHKRLLGAVSADEAPRDELDLDLVAQWLPELKERLTAREMHVCASFIQGMTSAAIAQSMGLKTSTVDTYAKRAFAKLGVDSRRQLIAHVLRNASRRHDA
ncbi:helix-turn-helix transcriptional regulator [Burkholderia sp. SCN-KJ]|uniref:helix-turn-helix domain-containing protein n=1 Tax=Burkholderia sp. SCN-KJ TaxID=2969248 RepID=UPI0021503778|nr:helix-turn-helix transcriptional regulator [Burkholderia sp. SCN-KJ]MCR4468285.1 helix-turn-helix transcriptional regulator [Burkholderia sp. SCN-KJ]